MKIALVSLNQIWEDKKKNLLLCEGYIKSAFLQEVDLIIFPEMTLTGFSTNISETAEDRKESETIKKFIDLAKNNNIAILFGVVIKNRKKAFNNSVFINRDGTILGEYSKIHPFSFAGEDRYFRGGTKPVVVNFEDTTIGLTICYDLRFPELYSAYAKESDIIVNIANWPSKRVDHWNTLLKARAIENQLFIIGVNRIGKDNNSLEYMQSSNIFNANGNVEKYEKFDDMQIYCISKNDTNIFKSNFNTVNDRKIELYKEIIDEF